MSEIDRNTFSTAKNGNTNFFFLIKSSIPLDIPWFNSSSLLNVEGETENM